MKQKKEELLDISFMLSLFYKYKNFITPCNFFKKEGTLDNGMKPF